MSQFRAERRRKTRADKKPRSTPELVLLISQNTNHRNKKCETVRATMADIRRTNCINARLIDRSSRNW